MAIEPDPHLPMVRPVSPRSPGHVECCDSSPLKHARAHAYVEQHPIVEPMGPGETWRWRYAHEAMA
ncbi:hypothetical protein JBE27_36880 [Streptomyces albiflaviniger]|nr:hypothetical protein [Streptomyces albiflaviniger]